MLTEFLYTLRRYRVPVSLREYMDLLKGLEQRLAYCDLEEFYALARTCCVKDEKYYDRFDQATTAWLEGHEAVPEDFLEKAIPEDWLKKQIERHLSPDELAKLQQFKNLDELLETFRKRLQEQKERHQGGNRMIGTGGTSPFGAYGDHPQGFRLAGPSRNKRAVKVWEQRHFRNLDDSVELGVRNIKIALRRLRHFARTGPKDHLNLEKTIEATAKQAGWLDLQFEAERKNAVKILLFFDVGGSMDPHIKTCEELFSAARTEFKHMEYFYFHNFFYESVWKDNQRRQQEKIPLWDVIHKYSSDYKLIIVGDASMSPYEIGAVGGSVEHMNTEPGEVWFRRLSEHFEHKVWLNPERKATWDFIPSIGWIRELMENKMYPLTLQGLQEAIGAL